MKSRHTIGIDNESYIYINKELTELMKKDGYKSSISISKAASSLIKKGANCKC